MLLQVVVFDCALIITAHNSQTWRVTMVCVLALSRQMDIMPAVIMVIPAWHTVSVIGQIQQQVEVASI